MLHQHKLLLYNHNFNHENIKNNLIDRLINSLKINRTVSVR